jgi:3-hydroxymyristoyl/3-hydroxydecanoyl-(acyl carrier protein) dehydratase
MVESVLDYGEADSPTLVAEYAIRRSDPVFAARRPPTYWPSVHVIEGLGQSCQLLSVLGHSESRTTVDPSQSPVVGRDLDFPPLGLLASVEVEIQGSARPGDSLRYHVTQTHVLDGLSRFRVSAYVKERMIASGAIVGAVMR